MHRPLVDGLEVDSRRLSAERDAQLVDDEGSAVRNRDSATDAGRSEILAPLEHLEEHPVGLLVEPQQPDELLQRLVLGAAVELELDRVLGEELAQFHQSMSRKSVRMRRRLMLSSEVIEVAERCQILSLHWFTPHARFRV